MYASFTVFRISHSVAPAFSILYRIRQAKCEYDADQLKYDIYNVHTDFTYSCYIL